MNRIETITKYYLCFKERDRQTLQEILTPDFVHKSPWGTFDNRDQMLDVIWPSVGKTWATDLKIFSDGSDFIVSYRHEGEHTGHLAERISFSGNCISKIEVYPAAN